MSAVPKLRFPEFDGEWQESSLSSVVSMKSGNFIRAAEILEASEQGTYPCFGGNGLRGYVQTYNHDGKYVLIGRQGALCGNVLLVNGLFYATEHAVVTEAKGGNDTTWLYYQLDRMNLNQYSTGLAQPGLSVSNLKNLISFFPSLPEQQKIASFLSSVDKKIDLLRQKKDGLEIYKKGLMQKIFSQEIRFKQDDGSDFPDWKEVALRDVLNEHKEKSAGQEPVFSVSVSKGLVNQIEHLGRSFSAADTGHYNKAKPHDVIYTKNPTGNFPLGIIKQSTVDFDVIVSPLYGVFTPETAALGFILNVYFESEINVGNYLSPLVQKGAKNTIACTNKRFLEGRLRLPRSNREQRKIADVLALIKKKIAVTSSQIEQMETFKKGLLQQMFI